MKTTALIARYLLGLVFTVFGLNGFLHFIPQPPFPAGSHAAAFTGAMAATGYFAVVFAVQFLCGLAFFAGLYVPLTLIVVAPVIFNVLLFHSTMAPAGLPPGPLRAGPVGRGRRPPPGGVRAPVPADAGGDGLIRAGSGQPRGVRSCAARGGPAGAAERPPSAGRWRDRLRSGPCRRRRTVRPR